MIEQTAQAILDFNGSGLSILEISHRHKDFQAVIDEAEALFKEILGVPEGYSVLFLGGGASLEFCMAPMNFLNKKAAYLNTGVWAKKAIKEAKQFGEVVEVASSADTTYNYIPKGFVIPDDVDYFHYTANNTIVQYIIMLVVAVTAFMFNFLKKQTAKYGILCLSVLALITYCYMGYMRQSAESIFAVFPLLAVGITPILGKYVDYKGKAASMLVLGSLLLIACHLTFAFVLPQFQGNQVGGVIVAYLTILVLGASFSLVPASLWPSVPKLVDAKIIGSAYALIFWIQNIGLWLFPLLIGKILDNTNPGVTDPTKLDYTAPLIMLACLGVAALLIGLFLKVVDKKKGYGLEEPNVKE